MLSRTQSLISRGSGARGSMAVERKISAKELQNLLADDNTRTTKTLSLRRFHKKISSKELADILKGSASTANAPPTVSAKPSGGGGGTNGVVVNANGDAATAVRETVAGEGDGAETVNPGDENKWFTEKELRKLIVERSKQRRVAVYKRFVSMLTLHGYPQFVESHGIRKFIWGVILLVMAGVVLRLIHLSYSPENVLKQIIELETQKMNHIAFPTVTMCAYTPVYTEQSYEQFPVKNITEAEYKAFYYELLSNRRNHTENETESDPSGGDKGKRKDPVFSPLVHRILGELHEKGYKTYTQVLSLFEKNKEDDINSEVVKKIMRHTRCLYENKPCDFEKDFRIVYRHTSQSLCLQFNYYKGDKESLISTGNDLENGFNMFWDISGKHYFYDYGLHGLLMEIHPYGTPHHLIDHRNTIYLEPGSSTNIDIEEVLTQRLSPPFKPNCGEQELEVLRNYPYSKAICETDCYLHMSLEKCGCVPDQFAEHAQHLRICDAVDMPCVFEASQEIHCHGCPVKCRAIHYHVSSTRLSIGNEVMLETMRGIKGWENKTQQEAVAFAKQYIVGFRIGFKSLERTLRNYVEAMAWFDRFSLLGGTIGLLMGLSVTTCFEFFFFLIDYVSVYIRYRFIHTYLRDLMRSRRLGT